MYQRGWEGRDFRMQPLLEVMKATCIELSLAIYLYLLTIRFLIEEQKMNLKCKEVRKKYLQRLFLIKFYEGFTEQLYEKFLVNPKSKRQE